jgi:hypothetical protein
LNKNRSINFIEELIYLIHLNEHLLVYKQLR